MESRYKSNTVFRDRQDAGRQLAQRLSSESLEGEVIVLGLPRGGVPVAYEIAATLHAPLDVLVVRKLGAPFNRELAIGAIGPGGIAVYNDHLVQQLGLDQSEVERIRQQELVELDRREQTYRGANAPPLDVANKTVILTDDGIATGSTMFAAVEALRALEPAKIIVAVPTSSVEAYAQLRRKADKVIALSTPDPYMAVGVWYEYFGQTSDQEVIDLLARPTAPPQRHG